MLRHELYVLSPLFRDKLRLFATGNGNHIGLDAMDSDKYLDRLEKFSNNLGDDSIWEQYWNYRAREFPHIGEKPVLGRSPIKDLLMNDNFTQNTGIKEIYRKGRVDTVGMRQIGNGNVKFINSMSRGLDRDILRTFLSIDDEYFNRVSIRPLI